MSFEFFQIPVNGGEAAESLNRSLRGGRIASVRREFVAAGENSFWAFCVPKARPNKARGFNPGIPRQILFCVLKGGSSKWLNESADLPGRFAWQAGYGWFSVGPHGLEAARNYVNGQKARHQTESFQDEFRRFLRQYEVDFDERYVWD